ncbi:solute carrier family 25, member 33/36 [Fistulifera solaris]|uniref:Solute carrier family 25, member 33/36 n=1 Tax=Fistulifera solaris TaxID=1519565 RepID=A0A1Z5JXL6_FISSO|nr:solute carrier family 25, member 33/36 [Fistulifera solaris]|eukprot:GAX18568.1 solute carrier family 25, member 33/36 [Fistulifera solaris]
MRTNVLLLLCVAHACWAASPASLLAVRVGQSFDRWTTQSRDTCCSLQSTNKNATPRGGSKPAVKTMTATQMELFKIFSGGVAGTIASCITNPLDVIKTQLQSSNTVGIARRSPIEIARRIVQQDGLAGFFRGLPPTLVGIIPSRSAYFYAYQQSKHALGPYFPEGSPPNALLAGFFAGIVGNTLTNPIWMVRTRMQIFADAAAGQRSYNGYGDAIKTIFKEEGIGGFYRGIQASYWGCLEGSVQFIVYEQLKTRLLKRHNNNRIAQGLLPDSELSKFTIFWTAALAKMIASIGTYPHEVARTRMREQARSGIFKYKGMWQTMAVIAKEEGRQGLYSGMGIHLVKVVPNSALMFLTYEVVRTWLGEFTIVNDDAVSNDPSQTIAKRRS